jgi:hypothetical protein
MYKLDPLVWFDARRVEFEPKHFVRAKTGITEESKKWIEKTLTGRYYIPMPTIYDFNVLFDNNSSTTFAPSFEDPSEAVFYELTWS